MRLLPEGPGADLTHKGLLPGVDLEVGLEVELLGAARSALWLNFFLFIKSP